MTVGELIRKAIKKSGMTQKDFAKEIGRSQQLVSDWINNRRMPNADEFLNIMTTVGMLEEIVGYFEEAIKNNPIPKTKRQDSFEDITVRLAQIEQALEKVGIVVHGNSVVNGHIIGQVNGGKVEIGK